MTTKNFSDGELKRIHWLVDKYADQIFKMFKQQASIRGYFGEDLDKVGLFDEIFCMCSDVHCVEPILDSIENNIGLEEYGFKQEDENES
jgi:hypothetical protein